MDKSLAMHSLADPDAIEDVGAPLLEDAGANARFAVSATARLEDDRLDPRAPQEQREQQTRGPAADDTDLRSRHVIASHASPFGDGAAFA
jgi:hypothetical protein